MMRSKIALAVAGIAALLSYIPAHAQISHTGRQIPLTVAVEAAMEAVNTCKASGYDVTATVVDVAGTPQVVLRGDHSTIHTKDTSFRKAYTIVTMGPIFKVNTTGEWLGILSKYNPVAGAALASTPNIMPLPGGVAWRVDGEVIGAIGVGGAPGAEKDEVCAVAGANKVKDKLPK